MVKIPLDPLPHLRTSLIDGYKLLRSLTDCTSGGLGPGHCIQAASIALEEYVSCRSLASFHPSGQAWPAGAHEAGRLEYRMRWRRKLASMWLAVQYVRVQRNQCNVDVHSLSRQRCHVRRSSTVQAR